MNCLPDASQGARLLPLVTACGSAIGLAMLIVANGIARGRRLARRIAGKA